MPLITITGHRLPPKAEAILKEILQSAGLHSARVTDTTRSFEQQAQTIVDYYKLHGSPAAKHLYASGPGGVAIDIYEKEIKSKPLTEVWRLMAASMRDAIQKERLAGGQRHLMHTSETHCVFDLAPSSIIDRQAFVREAAKHPKISRFLHPASSPPDKAFHLEIPNWKL